MSVKPNRLGSLILVALAYLVAIGAAGAWLRWSPWLSGRPWLDALAADLVATLVIFSFSRLLGNSSFYDAFWSVIPPLLLAYWWATGPLGPESLRAVLLAIVVGYWAVRLTGNWVQGFPGLHHEDWRYPMLRENAGRWAFFVDLFGIHVFPTLQVFLAMMPAYVAVTTPGPGLEWLSWIAFAIGIAAVSLEWAADVQMRRFVRARVPGAVMDQGLWAWSRHPNYLGEISFWLSIALFGVAARPAAAWWLFAGLAAMVAMFMGASIPMMEKRSLARRPHYRDVIERVPMLIPQPPGPSRPARRPAR